MLVLAILLLSLTLSFGEKTEKTVLYAAIIYGHGERTPAKLYPTDPLQYEAWPGKFGQLTHVGKKQHYVLGKWFRNRYSNLISEKFDPSEAYVRSTDADHTIISAQANLAGMYPPLGTSIWETELIWQPIPIHTLPEQEDGLLAMDKTCMHYTKEKEDYMNSKPYKLRLSKYKELMDYLTTYTGKKINDFFDMFEIYNILNIESLFNFTLPTWAQSVYPNKLQEPACYSFTIATATPMMARLMVGPLLKEIMTNVDMVVLEKNSYPLKLSIYSGHDFQIGNILSAMGVYDGNCPVYTATILFELLQDTSTKEYFIQMLYRNSTKIVEPYVLNIPRCGEMCPLDRFLELYDNLIAVNWEYDCAPKVSLKFLLYHTLFVINVTIISFRYFKFTIFDY